MKIASNEKKEKELKRIIEKASQSHDLLTPFEANIYLNYLEDMKKTNAKIIKDNTTSIVVPLSIPLISGVSLGVLGYKVTGSPIGLVVGGTGGYFIAAGGVNYYIEKVKKESLLVSDVIDKINENKHKKEENKEIKAKMKKINKTYPNDSILEPTEELNSINQQNSLLNNVDQLVNKINVLNGEDKKELLEETKKLLTEYVDNYSVITNEDNKNQDNYSKLKLDTIEKLTDLEIKANEVRENQVTDEIDNDLLTIRELASKDVKVKKLKKNKRHIG